VTFRKTPSASCLFFSDWCEFFNRLQAVRVTPKVKVDLELIRKKSHAFSER